MVLLPRRHIEDITEQVPLQVRLSLTSLNLRPTGAVVVPTFFPHLDPRAATALRLG
jgi:hypothetical protein